MQLMVTWLGKGAAASTAPQTSSTPAFAAAALHGILSEESPSLVCKLHDDVIQQMMTQLSAAAADSGNQVRLHSSS